MFLGRSEEGGIRCVYHGWKFDVDDRCVDMPNVPPEDDLKHRVHAKSYRTAESHSQLLRSSSLQMVLGLRPKHRAISRLLCPLARMPTIAYRSSRETFSYIMVATPSCRNEAAAIIGTLPPISRRCCNYSVNLRCLTPRSSADALGQGSLVARRPLSIMRLAAKAACRVARLSADV
jgi:hypothetical protein